jgi:AraC-like DNA-binding protein
MLERPRFIEDDVWRRVQYYSCTRKVLRHLEQVVDRPIGLREMAAIACMEKTTFSKAFKRKTGITLHEFVRAYRISQAVTKMEQSDYSITEITFSIGYSSLDTFERSFKAVTGITPTAYRSAVRRRNGLTPDPPQNGDVLSSAGENAPTIAERIDGNLCRNNKSR